MAIEGNAIVGDHPDLPYYVTGGVFTDETFTEVVPGTEESYGPFEQYSHAENVWRGKMGWNVDNCFHRLFITRWLVSYGAGNA